MRKFLLCIITASVVLISCGKKEKREPLAIIPMPAEIIEGSGNYKLSEGCVVSYPENDDSLRMAAETIVEFLGKGTGLTLSASTTSTTTGIALSRYKAPKGGNEAYKLTITPKNVVIEAGGYSGAFYALQTIMQMLPPDVYSETGASQPSYLLPAVTVVDYPRFKWRGMHLDVSRHFFSADSVKRYIDILAMHKMNTFHWHLTDDQGWRVQIDAYPRLTEVAAWHPNREGIEWSARVPAREGEKADQGGFYTKEQIKDVVAYAAKRGITIVPEIEMPGHASEIISAYPEMGCLGKPQPMISGGNYPKGFVTSVCPGNDEVYTFYEKVLDEVLELFPSKYIHIGGDEASKEHWRNCPKCKARMAKEGLANVEELQSYMIKHFEKYLVGKGRKLIGWDEITEGGLAPEATVMAWRDTSWGAKAALGGHDVVMTPGKYLYFDYYQNTPAAEPAAIGGFITVKKVYSFEPIPQGLTPEQEKHILGAQANIWAEYIPTYSHLEYMLAPRIDALSEVVWSPKESRNWDDFSKRVFGMQSKRYKAMGVNAHPGPDYVEMIPQIDTVKGTFSIAMKSEIADAKIYYTLDGTAPTQQSLLYKKPIIVEKPTTIKAILVRDDKVFSKMATKRYIGKHLGVGKKISYTVPYSEQYPGKGNNTLIDGFTGTTDLNDGYNQGFANKDLEVIVDLGKSEKFSQVTASFIQSIGTWVYFPEALVVMTSEDGKNFVEAGRYTQPFDEKTQLDRKQYDAKGNFKGRYVKVIAINPITPVGLPGAGGKNWLFTDEIFIF